jgi:outer membrane beta-barrel protein
MNQARIGLLVIAAMLAGPSYAYAQKKAKKAAATKTAPAQPEPAAAEAAPAAGGPVEIDADNPEGAPGGQAAPEAAQPGETPGAAPTEGGIGDICQIDPTACPTLNLKVAAERPLNEQMYAVQQIYALHARRFEIQPAWNVTLNDQFVDHPGPVLGLNYYVTNVLAIGINGGYYFNTDKVFNAQTRRAARVSVPLTEYLWQAALNFTYVPMYGKFAGFSDFIFHYDVYMVGGVGAITTRPIPVVDPDNRSFKWGDPKVAFNVGIGLRIFFNRWFAADLEVRDYVFQDKLEATTVAATAADKANPDTWYGENKITNNVQAQLGVSIFLPTSWEYRLPK